MPRDDMRAQSGATMSVMTRIVLLSAVICLVVPRVGMESVGAGVALADDGGGDDGGGDDGGGDDGGGDDGGGDDGGGDDGGGDGGGGASAGRGGGDTGSGRGRSPSFGRGGQSIIDSILGVFDRKPVRRRTVVRREAAPNEIVATDMTDSQIQDLVSDGYTVLQRDTLQRVAAEIVRLRVPRGVSLADARSRVAALNPQAVADLNHYFRTGGNRTGGDSPAPFICKGIECMAPSLISWPMVSGRTGASCGGNARIGLIDTGINPKHESFEDGRLEVIGAARQGVRKSSRQHGTAVAAILLGSAKSRTPGLLPDATIIAVDAFYRGKGNDERSDAYTLVKAMDMLAQRKVTIVNMSLAGPPNSLVEKMVARLKEDGIVIVAAAGNGGPRAKPAYPGAYPGVITVTAIDRNKKIYRRAGRGEHIDFAAPGVAVWTAASVRGARTKTGTSFAVPFVTASAALVQAGQGITDPDGINAFLADRALDLGKAGRDEVYGHGLVQANGLCSDIAGVSDPS